MIIKGRGWNTDDKKKWQLCVCVVLSMSLVIVCAWEGLCVRVCVCCRAEKHVGVHFQYMMSVFICILCMGYVEGIVSGLLGECVKVKV